MTHSSKRGAGFHLVESIHAQPLPPACSVHVLIEACNDLVSKLPVNCRIQPYRSFAPKLQNKEAKIADKNTNVFLPPAPREELFHKSF